MEDVVDADLRAGILVEHLPAFEEKRPPDKAFHRITTEREVSKYSPKLITASTLLRCKRPIYDTYPADVTAADCKT